MAFCGKCGNELRAGANFCPKCGTPIGNPQVNRSSSENYSSGETSQENQGGSKWKVGIIFFVVVIAILGGAMAFLLNFEKFNGDFFCTQEPRQETEQIQNSSPSIEKSAPIQEEKPSMQNDEEFKRKTMEYVSQIQDVMVRMNNVYNSYISSRSSDIMNDSRRVNAQADLMNLLTRGEAIFDKMISMARQKKYQDAIDAFKQEKEDFKAQWRQMDAVLTQDMY